MARVSFNTARTGRRPGSGQGNGIVEQFKWEMGERIRVTLPIINNELIIFSSPVHKVEKRGYLSNKTRQGSNYSINEVRCTHLYSQVSEAEQRKILEKGETCVFCELALYEARQQAEKIVEEFGPGGFSKLSKDDQKAFYTDYEKTNPSTVSSSYYSVKDDDGNKTNLTHTSMQLLVLRFKVDEKGKPIYKDGKPGVVDYTPQLMPVTMARLDKFTAAIDALLAVDGSIEDGILHTIGEGEDAVHVGFVDFMMFFPKETKKMESGRKLSVTPIVQRKQSLVTPELIADFEEQSSKILADSESIVRNVYKNLQLHSRDEALDLITRPGITGVEYYNELRDKYRIKETFTNEDGKEVLSDEIREQEVFRRVAESLNEEVSAEESKEETKESPDKEAVTKPRRKFEDLTPEEQEVVRKMAQEKKAKEEEARAKAEAEAKAKDALDTEELLVDLDDLDGIV